MKRRYARFTRYLAQAPWVAEGGKEGLDVPKGHAVHHMLAFVFLWGAIDNARLNNFEHDHTTWVKKAVRRTRMHLKTMIHELEGATDRIMAARYVKGLAAEWVSDWNVGCMVSLILTSKLLILVSIFLRQMGPMEKNAPPQTTKIICGA